MVHDSKSQIMATRWILGESFRRWKESFWLFSGFSIMYGLPLEPLLQLLPWYGQILLIGIFVISIFVSGLAIAIAMKRHDDGQPVSFWGCVGRGFRLLPLIIPATLLSWLIIGFASLFLLLPGIYMMVRYSLLNPVVAFEEVGADVPLERSKQLTKGNMAVVCLPVLIFTSVIQGCSLLISHIEIQSLNTIISGLFSVIISGFQVVTIVVVYNYCLARYADELAMEAVV